MTNIKIQKTAPLGQIILNSPETLNFIEEDTFDAISRALTEFEADDEVKVILLKANCGTSKKTGQKIFSAGINLNKYKTQAVSRENLVNNRKLLKKIEEFPRPVIIAIDGLVIGGFFELALACDIVLASTSAVFSLNEVNIGLIPGYGGIHRLLRLLGKNRAYEIIATGRRLSADEALRLGIVTELYNDEEFDLKVAEYCNSLAGRPSGSLHLIKDTMRRIINGEDIDEVEVDNFMKAAYSDEARRRIRDFLGV